MRLSYEEVFTPEKLLELKYYLSNFSKEIPDYVVSSVVDQICKIVDSQQDLPAYTELTHEALPNPCMFPIKTPFVTLYLYLFWD